MKFFRRRILYNRNQEVDNVLPWQGKLIPIEVKSGSIGKLKSLHQFIDRAPHNIAVRVYQGEYMVQKAKTIAGKNGSQKQKGRHFR